ncbi:cell wall hydrolase [Irregularibacter muris]|uniref:Cell wall hydrolase n=1 Tax=Irregularibacter muris TaxID=1796619 RepID=A0AAE3HDY5_9FIRM|nr:cell wall hydrolase [Irregularibacter muris]MCR1897637.1 cell wall hydrolase [Irregularibacter muris]
MKTKKKIILTIFIAVLMLAIITPEVLASESYRLLKFGSRGNDVAHLQQTLQNRGYSISVDGIYGKKTERTVINFQINHKLRIDGIAGRETQSKLFGNATTTSRGTTSNTKVDSNDIYWLARIIQAEAGAEPYKGKVAVGNVIINRVNSKDFPNTVYNVIFEYYKNIPQFSPVADGTIYNNPSQESIQAAKEAIGGARPVGNSTYFFNPSKAAGSWIVNNKAYVTRIGGHVFYQ